MSRPIDAENRQKPQKLIVRENRNNSDAYHLYCPICKWPVGEWYARSRWTMMYDTNENVCPHCGQVFDLKKNQTGSIRGMEQEDKRMIFLNIDKRLDKNGYKIVRDDKYGVEYEKEEPQGYKHKVAILHKASGNHIMQSYTDINQVVGLTLEEQILFTRKFKQLSRAWNMRAKDEQTD